MSVMLSALSDPIRLYLALTGYVRPYRAGSRATLYNQGAPSKGCGSGAAFTLQEFEQGVRRRFRYYVVLWYPCQDGRITFLPYSVMKRPRFQ